MPRPRAHAISLSAQAHLWCPGMDEEMEYIGLTYVDRMGLFPEILVGGSGGLDNFTASSKLYILAHGHSRMPLFKTQSGSWTAKQLVDLLVSDGLPKDQRDIELLVCHAGESVNTIENAGELMKLRAKALAKKSAGKDLSSVMRKYDRVQQRGMKPGFFEGEDASSMLLPMAAQLTAELKAAGFTNFRVISYKCPVAQYCPDGKVHLDLKDKGGSWGVSVEDRPEFRVIWQ